jgi:hypothetical protein
MISKVKEMREEFCGCREHYQLSAPRHSVS